MSEIIQIKDKLVTQVKDYPGLLSVKSEHVIEKSTSKVEYFGPKIPPDEWAQVLSFFAWTYDTTKSESQVRAYVNTSLGTWKFWAFPQEARTGMSAKEIDTPEAQAQRAMFGDEWTYFGTVHHHCSFGAFQSGTDKANEQDQAGLHITVGDIDKDRHSLHSRFYIGGKEYTVDMAVFWDVSEQIKSMVPSSLHGKVAEYQMSKSARGVAFPQQWKQNLVEVKVKFEPSPVPAISAGGYGCYNHNTSQTTYPAHTPYWKRGAAEAIRELKREVELGTCTLDEMEQALTDLSQDKVYEGILGICVRHNVDADDVIEEWSNQIKEEEALAIQREAAKGGPSKDDESLEAAAQAYLDGWAGA